MPQFTCIRCGLATCPSTDPPTGYCVLCIKHFREVLKEGHAKGKTPQGFADGSFLSARDCPVCILVSGRDRCSLCGSLELVEEYGHTPFGCGTFKVCDDCKAILDFREDKSGS